MKEKNAWKLKCKKAGRMINEKDLQVNEFQGQQKKVKQIGNKRPMETGDIQTEKKKF